MSQQETDGRKVATLPVFHLNLQIVKTTCIQMHHSTAVYPCTVEMDVGASNTYYNMIIHK
jgi:hypothetical protein